VVSRQFVSSSFVARTIHGSSPKWKYVWKKRRGWVYNFPGVAVGFRCSERALMYLNKDVIPFNFKGIALNAHRRISQGLPGSNVVLPTMPGTSNDFASQFAFAQRPSAMQASIIDGEKLPLNISNRHGSPIHLKLANGPSRNIILTSSPQKRH
jgi:hypothetical protein